MEKYSQQMHRYVEFYTVGQKDGLFLTANNFYDGNMYKNVTWIKNGISFRVKRD